MKFQVSKKFCFMLLALIIIGLFVYLAFFAQELIQTNGDKLPDGIKKDNIPPSTRIISPENKSWWSSNFQVVIDDSDIGSGLVDFVAGEKGCQYLIVDLGTDKTGGGFRKCDFVKITVPVGLEKTCSSSYSKDNISLGKCQVSTKAFDKEGNDSGWKSKVFNIDLLKPEVQKIDISENLELNKKYVLETTVSDNSKITGCWLYINGKPLDDQVVISPLPCENENLCNVSLSHSFDKEGEFFVKFGCSDIAGNVGLGESVKIQSTTNHAPKISSCKVTPFQGTKQTAFYFEVIAEDQEQDEISYIWDFGDNKGSTEKNPTHFYENTGVFKPKVSVADSLEKGNECQTAWVTIVKE